MSMYIKKIARQIASNVLFWRVRHIFQPSWMLSYEEKDSSYILELVKSFKCKTVLDYGCASGKTLEDIKDLSPEDTYIYGIDINISAVNFCKNKFHKKYTSGFMFKKSFNIESLNKFLLLHKKKEFDLIIFDRVLYCIDDKTLSSFLADACNITNMIFIDDFDSQDNTSEEEYLHRNWAEILSKFNFRLISKDDTCYQRVERASAKSMVFKMNQ